MNMTMKLVDKIKCNVQIFVNINNKGVLIY